MDDDLDARAEAYERKLAAAGGPDAMVRTLSEGLDRQTRVSIWLAISLILDLVLSLLLAYGYLAVNENSKSIDHLQARTSDQVLCPLYGVFLKSIDQQRPTAADANQDGNVTRIEEFDYANAVEVIEEGYSTLGCVPPRK